MILMYIVLDETQLRKGVIHNLAGIPVTEKIYFIKPKLNLMKKMNLNLGRIGKMLLPVFFLMGLFLLNANTVQAQSAEEYVVKVKQHVNSLPKVDTQKMLTKKNLKEEVNNPALASDLLIGLETEFGRLVIEGITRNNFEAKEAVDKTYELLGREIPAEYLDPIKEIYVDLLN